MKAEVDLGYTDAPIRSKASDRTLGCRLRQRLISTSGLEDPLHRFLARSFQLPLSVDSYSALSSVPLVAFSSEPWICLPICSENQPIIPNVFLGLPEQCLLEFRSYVENKRSLFQEDDFLENELKAERVFQAFEAILLEFWPPLLISIYAGRSIAAMPRRIDICSENWMASLSQPSRSQLKENVRFKMLRSAMTNLRSIRRKQEGRKAEHALEHILSLVQTSPLKWEAEASRLVYQIYKMTDVTFTTSERYAMAMVGLLEKISCGRQIEASKLEARVLRLARKYLLKNSASPEVLSKFRSLKVIKRPEKAREYELVRPSHYEEMFNYGQNSLPKNNIRRAALRIITAVLFECGRRAACIRELTLGDFRIGPYSGQISLHIRSSKSDASSRNYLPISLLWPKEELEYLLEFLALTKDIPNFTKILDLGEIKVSSNNWEKTRAELSKALAEGTNRPCVNLHLPRITWATFWPVRVHLAWNLCDFDHPLMGQLKSHRWFSVANLSKLRTLLETPVNDSVEIARRVMGHASWDQFITSYNRSWPLLVALLGHRY